VSELALRQGIATLLWLMAAAMIVVNQVISLRHAMRAAQGKDSDIRAPLGYALFAMLGTLLAVAGLIIWIPPLISYAPFWLVVICLMGLSSYVNWRIRRHYSVKQSDRVSNRQNPS